MRAIDLLTILRDIPLEQRIRVRIDQNREYIPKDGCQVLLKVQQDGKGTLELTFSGSSATI